jgi:hypothetical protein
MIVKIKLLGVLLASSLLSSTTLAPPSIDRSIDRSIESSTPTIINDPVLLLVESQKDETYWGGYVCTSIENAESPEHQTLSSKDTLNSCCYSYSY